MGFSHGFEGFARVELEFCVVVASTDQEVQIVAEINLILKINTVPFLILEIVWLNREDRLHAAVDEIENVNVRNGSKSIIESCAGIIIVGA